MKREARRPDAIVRAFEDDCVLVPIASILPVRALRKTVKSSHKYRQIAASIREVGLVELPVVARDLKQPESFLLLNGHLRLEILKDMGTTEVECLVSRDDEAFTYNKRISRLAAVQEHKMILPAIERGVPEEKIAKALDINVHSVQRKVRMLDDICEEAIALLKDKTCPIAVFEILRRMTAMRQIEAAELLINANNYSVSYASAILAGTPQAQLVESDKPKRLKGMTPEAIARMERELGRLQEAITSIQDTYGKDHLQLTVVKGYITRLLGNARVVRYLMQHRPEFMAEFQAIAEMTVDATLRGCLATLSSWGPGPDKRGDRGRSRRWGGSSAAVEMAANPFGAHQAGEFSSADCRVISASMMGVPANYGPRRRRHAQGMKRWRSRCQQGRHVDLRLAEISRFRRLPKMRDGRSGREAASHRSSRSRSSHTLWVWASVTRLPHIP
jgi:hypothetical protein